MEKSSCADELAVQLNSSRRAAASALEQVRVLVFKQFQFERLSDVMRR
jgi:hypothetical protein